MKKQWVMQAWIGSMALNVALLSVLSFLMWHEKWPHPSLPYSPLAPVLAPLDEASYLEIKKLSFEALVALLEDRQRLRAGYRMRDVALGVLVSKYDFDLETALGKKLPGRVFFEDGQLYPYLTHSDYGKILHYLQTHTAPFTVQGLFKRLPATGASFCTTEHYLQLETLLHRFLSVPLTPAILLTLCQEAGWPWLERLHHKQMHEALYDAERAREFLVDALYAGSRQAAYLLLIGSPGHRLEELNDLTVELLLERLDVNTAEVAVCCKYLMQHPRSRAICQLAQSHLGEKPFVPPTSQHIVQAGESLWTIAKKYQCSVEQLKHINPHAEHTLRPGMSLKLP